MKQNDQRQVIIFLSAILIIIITLIVPKSQPRVQLPPTPKIFKPVEHYEPPKIAVAPSYTLIFVGDSMIEALGENFDNLRLDLKKYSPEKVFGLFNYGYGSSNILSTEDRLNNETIYQGKNSQAILDRYFDIIFIESFGNNPLSQFPLEEGLKKQTTALDFMVAELTDTHPHSLIVFIATLAPSQALYGKGVVDLSLKARNQWANERRAYIENHINYAKNHNIPLINIYEKTQDKNGLVITKYLSTSDYIHPSSAGITLISQMIADYLYQNSILPN